MAVNKIAINFRMRAWPNPMTKMDIKYLRWLKHHEYEDHCLVLSLAVWVKFPYNVTGRSLSIKQGIEYGWI